MKEKLKNLLLNSDYCFELNEAAKEKYGYSKVIGRVMQVDNDNNIKIYCLEKDERDNIIDYNVNLNMKDIKSIEILNLND